MSKEERYEKIKADVRKTDGRYKNGSFLIFGNNGTVWGFNVDEKKLFDNSDKHHTIVSQIVGTGANLLPMANVPDISMKEIAGYEFQSGIDNPGCIVTGIGGKNKFEKFEKLIQLLIEDDLIWVDLYMNARMEEHWNEYEFSKYRTFQSMFDEWKLYQIMNEIRAENGLFSTEKAPFMFYHDNIETDISAPAWESMFNEINKNNFKIDGNEITIQNNGIEITFEIKMMPDEGNMEYENKEISCSIISCDFAKNIAINSFYPSNKWFEKNGYCSRDRWESWIPFGFEEYIVNEFTWEISPTTGEEFKAAIERIISMIQTIMSEGFARKAAIESTISIAMRFWQEKEWPDPHHEDSYTMQDYWAERQAHEKKIRAMIAEEMK